MILVQRLLLQFYLFYMNLSFRHPKKKKKMKNIRHISSKLLSTTIVTCRLPYSMSDSLFVCKLFSTTVTIWGPYYSFIMGLTEITTIICHIISHPIRASYIWLVVKANPRTYVYPTRHICQFIQSLANHKKEFSSLFYSFCN